MEIRGNIFVLLKPRESVDINALFFIKRRRKEKCAICLYNGHCKRVTKQAGCVIYGSINVDTQDAPDVFLKSAMCGQDLDSNTVERETYKIRPCGLND